MALAPPIAAALRLPIRPNHRRPPPLLRSSLPLLLSSPSNPSLRCSPRPLAPVALASAAASSALAESDVGEGFFEAIEELESMVRDPADVLGDLVDRLSARELQLVLVYFAQDGRDSYCALEVFDWLRRENRVDGETMELMVSIACGWIERLVDGEHAVEDVLGLLNEMECVGLEPGFSLVEKVVSLYWERGKESAAVDFVKDVVRRGGIGGYRIEDDDGSGRGGPVGYLVWKMMIDGNYMGAVNLVIELKKSGLKPEVYGYVMALTALVKEQKEFSKALRKLKGSVKSGSIAMLDQDNLRSIEKYQQDLVKHGLSLSQWALQEGGSTVSGVVHERLLAMYTCAGYGREAEQQLWHMKLSGKEPGRELYDVVLAICASQKEESAVRRLLAGVDNLSAEPRKKTLSWLLRGYVKGGYYLDASETLIQMLNLGLRPDYLDRAAVLQGLRRSIQESGDLEPYIKLCKHLSDRDLIGPCLVYLYIPKYKLWILKML